MNSNLKTTQASQYADLNNFEAIALISPYLTRVNSEPVINSRELSIGLYDLDRLEIADKLLGSASSFDEIKQARELVRGVHGVY